LINRKGGGAAVHGPAVLALKDISDEAFFVFLLFLLFSLLDACPRVVAAYTIIQ
jgi:hypothetical protein